MSCTGSCSFHHSISGSCYCYGNDHYYNYYYENMQRAKNAQMEVVGTSSRGKYETGKHNGHWKLSLYIMENGFGGKKIRISFTFWGSGNCFLEGAKARINHLECPVLTVVLFNTDSSGHVRRQKVESILVYYEMYFKRWLCFLVLFSFDPFLFLSFFFLCSTFIYLFIGA